MPGTNSPAERKFFDAIACGDIATIERMVREDCALLDAYDYQCFGATPITRVCFGDHRPVIEALIRLGADVNRRSDWEMGPWSPLHSAVTGRRTELAEFLLEHGATLDAHGAAGLGRLDDLKRLLDEEPARVHEPGGDGCQPLHFADTVEVAELLLERGADINARCIDHYSTPVQYLASCRCEVARHLFAQGAEADIFSATMAGDHGVVQKLIQENPAVLDARINQETFPPGPEYDVHNVMTFTIGEGCGPLHAAVRGNHPSMIDLLVDSGLHPDVRGGYDDQTPLHSATWNDLVAVAEKLLDRGADINIRSGHIHNNSPAGWAIVAGSADVFDLLIDRGADVLEWFLDDALASVAGRFTQFKCVPPSHRDRILRRLQNLRS